MKNVVSLLTLLSMIFSSALYAEGEPSAPPEPGFEHTLVMIGLALLFFYLILWRPEQKRRKALETQRNSIKPGDKVTAMGIIGTVVRLQEHTVILKMYDGTKLEFLKAAINEVFPEEEAKKADKESKESKEERAALPSDEPKKP